MTAHPTMPCPACDGDGFVPLPPHLWRTLIALRREGPMTVAEVRERIPERPPVGHTAINNRLEALRRTGLVTRRRLERGSGWGRISGKTWVYEATP